MTEYNTAPAESRRDARAASEPSNERLRDDILAALRLRHMTADEVAVHLGYDPDRPGSGPEPYRVRPRITELRGDGLVVPVGRRMGLFGRVRITVWAATGLTPGAAAGYNLPMVPAKVKEAEVLSQVRNMLALLKITSFKHWSGPMSERGIPDVIASIPPMGRLLMVEVKRPGGVVSDDQQRFLERWGASGALCLVVDDPKKLVSALADAGYEPALRVKEQFH